jgi:radical SAM protein with 4Fe4S-binding SPASM domain
MEPFLPASPLHVVVVLSDACNLRCVHCSTAAGPRQRNGFSHDEAVRLLDDLARFGVIDVSLSGGEPLMREDLAELVRHGTSVGMRVGTSTNGTLLSARRAAELRDAGLSRLQVSLDGREATHDRIRGRGSFAAAVRAIRTSVEAELFTRVCFTAMRENHRDFPAVVAVAAEHGARGVNLSQFVGVGRGRAESQLGPQEARGLVAAWLSARALYPGVNFCAHLATLALADASVRNIPGFIGCHAGIYIACVCADGSVTPCVMMATVIGNVRDRPFSAIWSSSGLVRRLRDRQLEGRCGPCPLRWSCGGCRAAAFASGGDPLSSDPTCWIDAPMAETSREEGGCSA